ncbi:MAG: Fpg/Nei family DNA glycosylase [Acidimicrobiales bacterium]
MPEGDTIHRSATALRMALTGRPVSGFDAPRLDGPEPTVGSVIERVEAIGKHLEIGFDDGIVLHTHMRMTGSWHLYREGEGWHRPLRQMRCVLEVPGWQAVCFNAPVVEVYRSREMSRHPLRGSLGPDLCTRNPDLDAAVARMARFCDATTTVATALLDQRIACGVGNVYKSEVLWACELHPDTPVGALDVAQRRRLVEVAASLLSSNLERVDRITVPGGLAVYGRNGKPCPRCATSIAVARHGEQARVTYWCPACQLRLGLAVAVAH